MGQGGLSLKMGCVSAGEGSVGRKKLAKLNGGRTRAGSLGGGALLGISGYS